MDQYNLLFSVYSDFSTVNLLFSVYSDLVLNGS